MGAGACAGEVFWGLDALEVEGDGAGAGPASNANTSIIQYSMYGWF